MTINETVTLDNERFKIESKDKGYKITSSSFNGMIYHDEKGWHSDAPINLNLLDRLGNIVDEIIIFRAIR